MRDRDTVETFAVKGLTVRIEYDTDASSPRHDDNLGTMVCWHSRYTLGDEHTFDSPNDFLESLEYLDAAVVLPLFLYDHSGITMSTGEFIDPWDSGQVGYIYISKDKARKEYGWKRLTKARIAKLTEYLTGEVKTYDDYLTGQVYGFVVETPDGESLDSCWGFYGLDYCKVEARAIAEHEATKWTERQRAEGARVNA